MRAVYQQLELGDFDRVLPALKKYFADKADYQTNRFQLSPEQRAEIDRRWQPFLERYGYAERPAADRRRCHRRCGCRRGATQSPCVNARGSLGQAWATRPAGRLRVASISHSAAPRESSSL